MKDKYCPYCDQKMTSGLYCKGCKRIVLHPYWQDVDYYLNERHPQQETDCLYHNSGPEPHKDRASSAAGASNTTQTSGTARTSPTAQTSGTARTPRTAQASGTARTSRTAQTSGTARTSPTAQTSDMTFSSGTVWDTARNSSRREPRNSRSGVVIFLILWLLLSAGGSLFVYVKRAVRNSFYEIRDMFSAEAPKEYYAAAEEQVSEVYGDGELSDEQVIEAGINCNCYGHYDVYLEDIDAALEQALVDRDILVWDRDSFSYNFANNDSSWYNTDQDYSLSHGDEYIGTITISVDTATNQLHGISATATTEVYFYELADVIESIMYEFGYVNTEQSGQDIYAELLNRKEAIRNETEDEIHALTTEYGSEIFVSRSEMSDFVYYSMEIYAPGYYTEPE